MVERVSQSTPHEMSDGKNYSTVKLDRYNTVFKRHGIRIQAQHHPHSFQLVS